MQPFLYSDSSNPTPSTALWLDVPLYASASLAPERSGGAKQLTRLSFPVGDILLPIIEERPQGGEFESGRGRTTREYGPCRW